MEGTDAPLFNKQKKRIAIVPKVDANQFFTQKPQTKRKESDDEDNGDDEIGVDERRMLVENLQKEAAEKDSIKMKGSVTNPNAILKKKVFASLKKEDESIDYKGRLRQERKPVKKHESEATCRNSIKSNASRKGRASIKAEPQTVVDVYDLIAEQEDEHYEEELENPTPQSFLRPSGRNLDWDRFLDLKGENIIKNLSVIPPVDFFKNAPLTNIWKDIAKPGLAIELRNPFVKDSEVYWFGTIVCFAGYRALVKFDRLEGESASSKHKNYLAWISFCSDVPKPLGWTWKHDHQLIPGPVVSGAISEKVRQGRITAFYNKHDKNTISKKHKNIIIKEVMKMRTVDHTVPIECLDLKTFNATRLARITTILGNRIHVQYYDDEGGLNEKKKGYCVNYKSPSIHPFGWSKTVGVKLYGNPNDFCVSPLGSSEFPPWPSDKISILGGMRLETRHPYLPYKIVGAAITRVYNHGYFEVETRDLEPKHHVKWIYHVTSPFIFPIGFGKTLNIDVEYFETPDESAKRDLLNFCNEPLRLDLLPPKEPTRLSPGMKVEAVDVVNGTYLGPATVKQVCGHLFKIYFDKMREDIQCNYYWVDIEESDIYPLGYSELVHYDWQGNIE